MKTRLILYIMALSVLAACSDLETGSTRHTATQIAVTPPVGISGMQITSQQIKITNLTTGVITTRRVIFTPNVDIKDELQRTPIQITCIATASVRCSPTTLSWAN